MSRKAKEIVSAPVSAPVSIPVTEKVVPIVKSMPMTFINATIRLAREVHKLEIDRIKGLTDQQAISESAALIRNAKQLIESGAFAATVPATELPTIAIKAQAGNSFLIMVRELKTVKVDGSVLITDNKNLTTTYAWENRHTVSVGTFPCNEKGDYAFKTCVVEGDEFTYGEQTLKLSSFQPATGKGAQGKIQQVKANLTAEQMQAIADKARATLREVADKKLEKAEKMGKGKK